MTEEEWLTRAGPSWMVSHVEQIGLAPAVLARKVDLAAEAVFASSPPKNRDRYAGWLSAQGSERLYGMLGVVRWYGSEFDGYDERVRLERPAVEAIRDIFGNPFRPVAFDPSWRTSTAVGLTQRMYEARDFGAMPILADALEDAGCDQPDILAHCRGDGPHVRGCWVVDLVLGMT